ncbi:MAG: hypothetical protein QNJ44_22825 [Rhodobacter sp.]|nr:hypothetical protein [Rhodobacter sp.]
MSATDATSDAPITDDTTFDPDNPDHVNFVVERAIVQQFAIKVGLKIMSSVRTGEPISFT